MLSKQKHLPHIALFFILIVASLLIYDRHFIQDDAYISFLYAKHFAQGQGLVWYPSSDEYGYTNFLYTLIIGLLMKAGIPPETAAPLITVPAALISLQLVYRIGHMVSRSPLVGLLASGALATNHTFAAYATGGLETSLVHCLVLAAYFYLFGWHHAPSKKRLWLLGFYSGLALCTRLDSVLLLIPAYVFLVAVLWQRYQLKTCTLSECSDALIRASVFPVVFVLLLLGFCLVYYGQALPNTFYAKALVWDIGDGFVYINTFLSAQYYMPALLFLLWFYLSTEKDFKWEEWGYRFTLLAALVLWLLYTLKVGGDFMGFRFILPILPFFYLLGFDLIVNNKSRTNIAPVVAAGCIVLFGNVVQPIYLDKEGIDKHYIESTAHLEEWLDRPNYNWRVAGKKLREYFYTGGVGDVHIATTAAGAIPYYSGLRITDQHGLNTRAVLNASNYFDRTGHRYYASIRFMEKAGVNLIIGHPIFAKKITIEGVPIYNCLNKRHLNSHYRIWRVPVVFIHIHGDYYLLAHYLKPHRKINKLIEEGLIIRHEPVHRQVRCGRALVEIMKKKNQRLIKSP